MFTPQSLRNWAVLCSCFRFPCSLSCKGEGLGQYLVLISLSRVQSWGTCSAVCGDLHSHWSFCPILNLLKRWCFNLLWPVLRRNIVTWLFLSSKYIEYRGLVNFEKFNNFDCVLYFNYFIIFFIYFQNLGQIKEGRRPSCQATSMTPLMASPVLVYPYINVVW